VLDLADGGAEGEGASSGPKTPEPKLPCVVLDLADAASEGDEPVSVSKLLRDVLLDLTDSEAEGEIGVCIRGDESWGD